MQFAHNLLSCEEAGKDEDGASNSDGESGGYDRGSFVLGQVCGRMVRQRRRLRVRVHVRIHLDRPSFEGGGRLELRNERREVGFQLAIMLADENSSRKRNKITRKERDVGGTETVDSPAAPYGWGFLLRNNRTSRAPNACSARRRLSSELWTRWAVCSHVYE